MSIYSEAEEQSLENYSDEELQDEYAEYAEFNCLDCKVNTLAINEYYMVQFSLWDKANPANAGMLCIGCLEIRIGRTLTVNDFIEAPVNYFCKFAGGTSERLMNRLTDKFTDEKDACTCIYF